MKDKKAFDAVATTQPDGHSIVGLEETRWLSLACTLKKGEFTW
jgi:hypothetical protein